MSPRGNVHMHHVAHACICVCAHPLIDISLLTKTTPHIYTIFASIFAM